MAVKIQVEAFCVPMPRSVVVGYRCIGGPLPSEDGGSMNLKNIGILPQHYTVSQLS
jgi:hypothetical protein